MINMTIEWTNNMKTERFDSPLRRWTMTLKHHSPHNNLHPTDIVLTVSRMQNILFTVTVNWVCAATTDIQ